MKIKVKDPVTGQFIWVPIQAKDIALLDLEDNFENKNVEAALRELSEKVSNNQGISELKQQVATNTASIKSVNSRTTKLEKDVEWLKENGGGGGGGAVIPTITSKFTDCAIQENTNVSIDIFFTSANLGEGTAYVTINGIESMYVTVKQGNNNISIASKYLTQMKNSIMIYVKDRAGLPSNQLEWNVIVGGVKLTTTFDTSADWSIGSRILFPYTITTEIEGDIVLSLKIGTETQSLSVKAGYNELYLDEYITGVGAYSVSIYATVGDYTSNVVGFNLVVSSSTELYISSTNIDGAEYTYGERIEVNYRLSKLGNETFTVYLSIDGLLEKTISTVAGNYYWTITGGRLTVGPHTLTIRATSETGDDKTLELGVNILKGSYTPLTITEAGLYMDLNAQGKSNQDSNLDTWVDASGNGNNAKIINANFSTNGWINDNLVLDNDAYVEIPLRPWQTNAVNGSTINIIYTPTHSGNEYARVLDYTDNNNPFAGIFIDILEANFKSESSKGQIDLDYESGEIDVSFVIDRNNKMAKIFVNGILSKYWVLSDTGSGNNASLENFAHDNYIYLNCEKGKDCGTNSIRRVLIYNRALSEKEILDNHIANITNLEKQEEKYNFEYNNTLPKLRIFGDISNVSADVSANVRIRYESPNSEVYGESFDFETANNPIFLQGTSSLGYVRKNYRFYLKDAGGSDYYFNPFGSGSKAENIFTIKCNYMESSQANGIGIASMVNDCVYDSKTPAQENDPNRRTAVNGFPIQLFVNDESYGTYTLQIDRYAEESLGYKTKEFPELICVEGRSNTDIGAGAFYKYGTTDASKGMTEWEYYNESFMIVAPSSLKESNYDYNHIKTLVEWVYDAERDRFVEELENYFNKEYLLRYFLTVQCLGMVDSLSKNMHLCSWDGKIFFPLFYDTDTATGLDNSGYLDVSASTEIGDIYDDDGNIIEENRFNCSNSVLWTKVMNWLSDDLKAEWTKMRSSGRFTVENIMHYMSENIIEKIPASLYNADQVLKYCNYGSMYQHVCHGSRQLQLKKWIRERIAYVDSLMEYMSDIDYATIRMETLGDVYLSISTYYPLYYTIKWRSGVIEKQRIGRGQEKTFSTYSTVSTDQEVILYYPKAIKTIKNIDTLNPRTMALGLCTQLNELECHSENLRSVDVSQNIYLRNLDFSGAIKLGTVSASLDVSGCKYLRKVNIYGTSITSLNCNASGGSIKEIYYPKSIQSIILTNQPRLEVLGLPYGLRGEEVADGLATVSLNNCPNINKLNTSTNSAISNSLIAMKYARNLTLNNSISLKKIDFDGFTRLVNVNLISIDTLEDLGFNNMFKVGESSTIKYIGVSNCSKLETITMNCDSEDYEITFADNAILNLQTSNVKEIISNCIIKGLETIIIPKTTTGLYFTDEYGSGYSSVKNIWSSIVSTVDTSGTTPIVKHLNGSVPDSFIGIDFKGLELNNIDLGALVNIPDAINFKLAPTHVNPNFNKNRDGVGYPYLQPTGTLDLSNYTGSLAKFFDGVDLEKLVLICNNKLPQSDISYCFYNAIFNDESLIVPLTSMLGEITNLDYCFYKTVVGIDILKQFTIGKNATMNYTFGECENIKQLSNFTLPATVISSEGTFAKCPIKSITNAKINTTGSCRAIFKGCEELVTVNGLTMPNTDNISEAFEGCINLINMPFTTITDNIQNIVRLYYGCPNINNIDEMVFGSGITDSTDWINKEQIVSANDVTIKNNAMSFEGYINLITCNNLLITSNVKTLANYYKNCAKLNSITFNPESVFGNVKSMAYMLSGCSSLINNPISIISDSCTNIDYLYNGTNITDISGLVIGSDVTSAINWYPVNLRIANDLVIKNNVIKFTGNKTLQYAKNLSRPNSNNWDNYFEGCISLKEDIIFPNNTTSVISCYKNCSSMTHVHSNWNNTYTNGITSTDCYAGCTAIAHIDNENIVTYEGKEGLDEIPVTWGGLELMAVNTYVLKFEIPSDNFTLKLSSFEIISGRNTVSWGDKTYTNGVIEHTYAKAGTYIVKSQLRMAWSGTWVDPSVRESLVEICQFPTTRIQHAFGFGLCTKLVKANLTNANIFSFISFFYNCSALEEVIFTNATITGRADSAFSNCTSLKGVDLSTVDFVGVDNLVTFLNHCSSLRYFYAPKNINVSMSNFTESIYLTSEHLMSIINNLNTVSTTQTLMIGSTNLAKLTAEQIKVATNKNWTVV